VTSDLRFIFDTNMLISALVLPRSVPRQAFDRAAERGVILVSSETATELESVVQRPKFDRYITLEHRLQFLAAFIRDAILVEVTETILDCRDPKDNKFLELAVASVATCIVSGDADLLVLHPFRGIPILTPRQFLDSIDTF
jgi:putative PIN family toxin of toxin-antitoxin system